VIDLELLLVGYGNVGRRFARLLDERGDALTRDYGVRAKIVGIKTRRGQLFDSPRGLEPPRTLQTTIEFIHDATSRRVVAAREGRLVVVETTTLNIENGRPAIDHVRAALAGGAHVVTANKGPAAFAYADLARTAADARRRFLFEGAVMDGVPIFNLARETLPALTVLAFRGVLNRSEEHTSELQSHA